jgi:hypothetical protein
MGDDKLGTMILSSNNLNSSLVMPEIPIRPNPSIPRTIGIFLILGSLVVIFDGGGSLATHFSELSEAGAANQVELMKMLGVDISVEEMIQWDSEFKNSNYHLITGLIKVSAGILLFIGGVQLLLKKYLGGIFSLSGGGLWFLSQVISIYWATIIEDEIGISLATQWDLAATAMCFICNLFCLILPLIPMFGPAGRAALTPPLNPKIATFSEEE